MNRKTLIIGGVIILIFVFAFLGFYFHNEINNYIENESWIYSKPYMEKSVELAKTYEGGKQLFTVTDGTMQIYDNKLKQVDSETVNSSNIIFKSKGPYTALASTDKNFVRLYKGSKLLWNKEMPFDIKEISVNKNGYVSIALVRSGYRSGVRLYSIKGEELLNIDLASTYAIDMELNDNNNSLFVAEVDFNGINATSVLKTIDVVSKEFTERVIGNDEIVVDLEYAYPSGLLIQTDKSIYSIGLDGTFSKLYSFEDNSIYYASINDVKYPFIIENNGFLLRSLKPNEERFLKLENKPQLICVAFDRMAIMLENEVWIINNNCEVIKKCEADDGLIDLKLFNNGRTLAMIFNRKVELLGI